MAEREWFDKDYYKVLGLRQAQLTKKLRVRIESSRKNITQTPIRGLKISSKKFQLPTTY